MPSATRNLLLSVVPVEPQRPLFNFHIYSNVISDVINTN